MNIPKIYDSRRNTVLGVKISALSVTIFIVVVLFALKSVLQLPLTIFDGIKKGLGFGQDTPTDKNIDQVVKELKSETGVKDQNQKKASLIAEQIAYEITGFTYSMSMIEDAFKQITTPDMMKAVYTYYGKRKNTQVAGLSFFAQTDIIQGVRSKLWSWELKRDVGNGKTINDKLNWIKS
ncbi:hypothetical protein ACR79P_06500 [Sphingobacterium spiritivorum]|uniref:hypothetical protein n=1 Tax=Sphingobacterium spiritivorum TaxID=258 RepID=UPI003DA274C8